MATIPKLAKRLTHLKGFMAAMEANQDYLVEYDEALYPTNVSYDSVLYNIEPNNYIIIKHRLSHKPDKVYFGATLQNESSIPLDSKSNSGDWHWSNDSQILSYVISNMAGQKPFIDYEVNLKAFKCRYAGCNPPAQPGFRLPLKSRPADALFWCNKTTWPTGELPKDNEIVTIPDGMFIVVDCPLPIFKYLKIEGYLELDNSINHTLVAELIFINGGQLIVGWEDKPIQTNVEIRLMGEKGSLDFYLPDGFNTIGGKGIGVYGGLDLHGLPRYPPWTTLESTAASGSNTITLTDPVDWQVGELIVLSPTSYSPQQTEVFKIIAKTANNKTLTLNASLNYDHVAFTENYTSGESYRVAAGVGLLSRNIKVIGAEYANQFSDLYGSRIIVSDYSTIGSDGSPVLYKGYARVSNVEFDHFGQFSRSGGDDYKYGILFSNLGDNNYSRPSYVKNSAFHNGFSAAVGILGSNSIPIEDNVIHHSIDYAIKLEGHSNIVRRNFIALVYWASTFITWEAEFNTEYWGAISAFAADSFVLEDNLITGSERLGVFYKGDVCDGEYLTVGMNHSIKNNSVHSTMAGVVILPTFSYPDLKCIKISSFTIFKSMHWGIYYQGTQSLLVESNKLIDNFVGVFSMVYDPSAVSHIKSDKWYTVRNSLVVGRSIEFDCIKDIRPNDTNYLSAKKIVSYGAGPGNTGKIGLIWSNFIGGSNGAPYKPWFVFLRIFYLLY